MPACIFYGFIQEQCPEGHYRKVGRRIRCGEGKTAISKWYCPRSGMEEAEVISPGYYGSGGTNLTQTLALACEAGHFCTGGKRVVCGGVAMYCAAKAASPTPVSLG